MRPRDPRRLLERRRRALGRVEIVETPQESSTEDGSVTTKQVADVTLPRRELDNIWSAEYLERLARTYWVFLSRFTLGLVRVLYTPVGREVVLIARPLRLLTFRPPEYDTEPNRGAVTWRIEKGILVAPQGRNKGYLRICVERPEHDPGGDEVTARVSSEVANFYPAIAQSWVPRRLARFGAWLYTQTQLRIHVIVTNAFLRSLARLELPESVVGSLRQQAREALQRGDVDGARQMEATARSEELDQASA
ncbi:MAG: hypothetical protein QOE06_1062 [Thermoleophilaceae bacterium]|nr:hypothetical protein [Thermoleophilaceae bacterium]